MSEKQKYENTQRKGREAARRGQPMESYLEEMDMPLLNFKKRKEKISMNNDEKQKKTSIVFRYIASAILIVLIWLDYKLALYASITLLTIANELNVQALERLNREINITDESIKTHELPDGRFNAQYFNDKDPSTDGTGHDGHTAMEAKINLMALLQVLRREQLNNRQPWS